jgi:hypothetical protein
VSIGGRSPRGYGEGQPDAEVPIERLRLPLQGASAQDGEKTQAIDSQAAATQAVDTQAVDTQAVDTRATSARPAASESVGLDATTPLMSRQGERPSARPPSKTPPSKTPPPTSSPFDATTALPQRDEPTIVTPGLDATRVGAPEPDDPMQRGLRVFRRSAGRSIDAADAVYGRIQRVTRADGAGESGLANVLEMGAVIGAGDLLVTLALANSLFFSVQPNEARSKVALYLLITMVPFTLLAPLIGPLLDRLRGGRRFAMAVTALIRALLCLVMAKTISGGGLALYPAAFGCLAASKAYGVSRAAVIPRVLPPGTTLVRANSRISLAALAATVVATPIGLGLGVLGPGWTLGFAALTFFLGTWLAIRLPTVVDSNEGELKAQLRKRDRGPDAKIAESMPDRRLRSVGPSVLLALRANAALRAFSGFLSLFMAFLVRRQSLGGLRDLTAVGVFAGAIFVGSALGSLLGAWLKTRAPEAIITGALALISVTAIVTAFFYGLPMVLVLAGVTGLAPALSKLSLDALLQRDTLERVRTSAFARSETLLQFAWVLGGAIGLALPPNGVVGVSIGALGLSVMALLTLKALYDLRWQQPLPQVAS